MSMAGEAIPSRSIIDPRFTNALPTKLSTHGRIDDSLLTRICWMPTHDIDLRFMSGSSFIGSFPDERIRKRTLFFFRAGEAVSYAIKEIPALIVTEESALEQQVLPPAEAIDAMGNSRLVRNTPRFCANTLLRQYHKFGMRYFEHLNGQEEKAKDFYDIIIPEDAIPVTTRTRLNQEFRGPFLDEVRAYLLNVSPGRVRRYPFSKSSDKKDEEFRAECMEMLKQMQSGAATAWGFQNAILNKSETQIREKRNGGDGKEWYDQRDERFEDSLPGLDSVFLADTNRQPLDVQELAAADKLASDTSRGTIQAVEVMMERLLGSDRFTQVADPRVALLEEKVEKLLAMANDRPDLRAAIARELSDMAPEKEDIIPPPVEAETVADPARGPKGVPSTSKK